MKMKLFVLLSSISLMAQGKVFAEGEEAMPPPDQSFWQTLVMIGIAFLFFYVILWRPEQKKRKELENQRSALKKGDRVVAMGTIGTVLRVGENTVIVKMYDGAKLEFYKAAITDILPEEEGKKADINSEE